jgi:lauroyl/myristoyl acyltransferase
MRMGQTPRDHARLRGVLPQQRDLLLLGYLPMMALIAWLTPEAAWPNLCAAAARISGYAGHKRGENARQIARLLAGRLAKGDADRIAAGIGAHHHQARLQVFRSYRFDAWRPRMMLIGREHVEQALAARRGAVLWVAPFAYSSLVTKMALHQSGFAVSHLTGAQHGVSRSRFGQRFLNPIWSGLERRFLVERVLMQSAQSPAALRELIRRLKDNQLVSITMGPNGVRRYAAPFFAGRLAIANGAPALARRTGAALLPVFTLRTADGSFVTAIEAPARLADDRDTEACERQLTAHCVRLLESYVGRAPDQFDGWSMASTDHSAT